MTTKADVLEAIEQVDARISELTPRLLAHADKKLPEGEWHVREALCHLAARANSVPLAITAAERARARAQGGSPSAGARIEIDEANRRQIEDRRDRTLHELMEEIHAGHRNALKAVNEFDDDTLGERQVFFPGRGEMSLADLVLRAGPGHENNHLDLIERAIPAS